MNNSVSFYLMSVQVKLLSNAPKDDSHVISITLHMQCLLTGLGDLLEIV